LHSAIQCLFFVCFVFVLDLDMARTLHVEGYDELQKVLNENNGNLIFVLFTGSVGEGGQSWCPDCVKGTVHESSVLTLLLFLIR